MPEDTEDTTAYERPTPTTVTETLEGAKAVLKRQGRTRFDNFGTGNDNDKGKVCLNGALFVAVGAYMPDGTSLPYDGDERSNLHRQALNALNKVSRDIHDGPAIDFNDRQDTTNEQVFALIDATIERVNAQTAEEPPTA